MTRLPVIFIVPSSFCPGAMPPPFPTVNVPVPELRLRVPSPISKAPFSRIKLFEIFKVSVASAILRTPEFSKGTLKFTAPTLITPIPSAAPTPLMIWALVPDTCPPAVNEI